MSKYVPFEIQAEIIKRLPVKSLIQFRSVSKAWKTLIESSHFIARYSSHMPHLPKTYYVGSVGYPKQASIVDDDSFAQPRVSLTLPLLVNLFKFHRIIGSSNGLLCFYGYYSQGHEFSFPGKHMAVLWNISVRKAVAVVEHDVGDEIYTTVIGFGVCRETTDPKIVKIKHIYPWSHLESGTCIPWQVEVFALSTGAWRSSYKNPPRKSIEFVRSQVVVDGSIYWLATNTVSSCFRYSSYNLIICFDITSEEFREVKLLDSLTHRSIWNLSISKLRESLVLLDRNASANNLVFDVWLMEDGVPNSFTKISVLNINVPDASIRGFKWNGEPIIEIVEDYRRRQLVVYEPRSKRVLNLGFDVIKFSFFVHPYMETLLLLDQPDFIIYNEGKRCILQHSELKALEEYKECINQ